MEELPLLFEKTSDLQNVTVWHKEYKHLVQNFVSLTNTIIISPRRWGKSSLINKVAQQIASDNKEIKVCILDVLNVRNENEFYERFSKSLTQTTLTCEEDKIEPIKKDDILNLAENLAETGKYKMVVCIGEFQTIGKFDETLAFQRKLVEHWQHHQNVAYCIYGSKRKILLNMFSNPEMPLYKFGDIMFLDKIDNQTWGKIIQKRFQDTGKSITEEQAEYLADLVENHSYYVQQLAQQVWLRTQTDSSVSIIDNSLQNIKNQLGLLFIGLVESLTATQLYFLEAIITGETVFGQENLIKYKLGTSANVIRIKKTLLSKEIIDIVNKKVVIQDPVFKLWLKEDYFRKK